MKDSIVFMLLFQIVLIGLNAIFASAEIAVLSLNETKLEMLSKQGNKKAKRLLKLTSRPAGFLATIQVAITLSGFLGSAFAADNFSDGIVEWLIGLGVGIPRATLDTIAVVLITLVLSYFTLVFGELVPKRIAMKKSQQLALGISGLISVVSTLFAPIVWFLSASTNVVLRLCGIDPNEEEEQVSEEEIRMMVDAGSEKGTIDHEEKEFIQNVFEFDDLTAGDIATHRTDVTVLWAEESVEDWEQTIQHSRYTCYPICEEVPDHVVGILNTKDYFRLKEKDYSSIMEGAVRTPYFVSETIRADVLFRNMKESGNTLAVVLDEYGGMVGIVTIKDLVEELVGELRSQEESQTEDVPHIEKLDDSTWEVNGNVMLSDIEQATGAAFHSEEYDTFTGLVFDALGVIPQDGTHSIDLEISGLSMHVSCIQEHQIQKATIKKKTETA